MRATKHKTVENNGAAFKVCSVILWNRGVLSIKFLYVTLWHMSIGARVVRSVALQEIDYAPHAQASAESHNKGL